MNRNVIVRTIERAPPDVVTALGAAGVATVHEAQGRIGLLGPRIRPIQAGVRVAGSAITVLTHPGDNMLIHAAIEFIEPGDMLVVAQLAPSSHGGFGDLLATSVQAHGAVGLVIDSGVRDTAEVREMGFPVWSAAVHAEGTVKASPGSVNVPVVCAGQLINPGDVVIADDDGVCVVGRSSAVAALDAANDRIAKEEVVRGRMADRELSVDFLGLRQKLLELGVEYVDTADEL